MPLLDGTPQGLLPQARRRISAAKFRRRFVLNDESVVARAFAYGENRAFGIPAESLIKQSADKHS